MAITNDIKAKFEERYGYKLEDIIDLFDEIDLLRNENRVLRSLVDAMRFNEIGVDVDKFLDQLAKDRENDDDEHY